MAILEHIRNVTPTGLYANGREEGPFTKRASGFENIIFFLENSLEDQ